MMVSICMITYNHENYLKQAIEAILNQKTTFDFELIVANDNSPDNTSNLVNDIIKNHEKGNLIHFLDNSKNIGIMPNFINALQNCKGKYIALCEGDDYWTDENKLQKQVSFLESNPDYVITFHKTLVEIEGKLTEDFITKEPKETSTIIDLANGNYIHTCTVMYRNSLFPKFPKYFYKSPIGDYFLHMLNSQYGKIYYMKDVMAVYRVHNSSYWSSKKQEERTEIWIKFIQKIKPFFKKEIRKILNEQIVALLPEKIPLQVKVKNNIKSHTKIIKKRLKIKELVNLLFRKKNKGLLILDDIFPSSLSPWRSNEYAELCNTFKHTRIYTDCTTYAHYNQNKSYEENLTLLTINYPTLKDKIFILKKKTNINYDLAYVLFYNNLIKFYPLFEKNNVNFAFTLYPGGGFGFNDNQIDSNLRTICKSKLFRGVIVNQNITKKYLIEKNICNENQIKLIFGVTLNLNTPEIKEFTYQKPLDCLNILFFANKYTEHGTDKGFDVFLKTVKQLLFKKDSLNFIVIGGFSENDVADLEIKNIIDFKGSLNEFEFNKILKQTHILISANKPFILSKNAFDGFPLATCVTASLYGNLNIMTDYFNEADEINLKDKEDFIKINSEINNVDYIVKTILELDLDRDKLQKIAENGRNKMLHLYSFENQISPRLDFFKNLLF